MTKKQLYSRLVSSLVEMSVRQQKNNAKGRGRKSKRNKRKSTNPAEVGPQETPGSTGDDLPGTANDKDGKPITNTRGTRGTPEQEVSMRGTKGIARATAAAGERGSIVSRLANRYANTLPSKSGSADKIRNFNRGVTKIGAGTASLIKKGLNKGKNVPLGGKSLV